MLTFFFIVSVLNLALGYGLALYLGNPVAARNATIMPATAERDVPQSEEEIHAILNEHADEEDLPEVPAIVAEANGVEETVERVVEEAAVPEVAVASVAAEDSQQEPAAEFALDPDAIKAALANADAGIAPMEETSEEPIATESPVDEIAVRPAQAEDVAEVETEAPAAVKEPAEESPDVETEALAVIEAFREQLAASTESLPEQATTSVAVAEEVGETEPIAASVEEPVAEVSGEEASLVNAPAERAADQELPEVENVDDDVMAGIQAFRDQLAAMRVG